MSSLFHGFVTTKYKKNSMAVKIPLEICQEAGLKNGDHIIVNANNGQILITKSLQCRICQKYTNTLSSNPVLAADDLGYYSLYHCQNCRDVPDYSRKVKSIDFLESPYKR